MSWHDDSRYIHLDRLSEVVATAFLLDDLGNNQKDGIRYNSGSSHMLVDLSGGDVVVAGQGESEISLVVTKVQVDLGSWKGRSVRMRHSLGSMLRTGLQNEAFTVLRRSHEAGINRHIGVDLDAGDSQPKCLEQLLLGI